MIERPDDRTPDSGQLTSPKAILTAREAAAVVGLNERTIRRAIARGDLPAVKHAGVFRIRRDDLTRYHARRNAPAPRRTRRSRPLLLLPAASARPPFHVPPSPAPLIGREREGHALRDLLIRTDVPLVTLVGPGGIGKTRLALDVAATVRDAFIDGIWFVDLSPLRDPQLVPPTIAQVLGVREVASLAPLDRRREYLEQRQVLLLLDNLEQVAEAGRDLATLLASCPRLTILATSRAPLHVSAERQFPVPPLLLPDSTLRQSLASVSEAAAVQLFCRKAQSVRPDFNLTARNAPAVSAACTRLDGLPLAIELAAARSNVLSPEALLERLDHRLPLLTGGPRDAPRRLHSMRDAIGWSYDLLDDSEQRLFRRLAVFAGGFTEEAAVAVGEEPVSGPTAMLEQLTLLVDKNLLLMIETANDRLRFTMLEMIREFGLERLDDLHETVAARDRQAAWCLGLVEAAAPWLFTSEQKRWSDTLQRELDNLRAALDWLSFTGDRPALVRLAGEVWPFWFVQCLWAEGKAWVRQALEWSHGDCTVERIRVLTGAGCLWMQQGDEPAANAFNVEGLSIARELGNVSPIDIPYIGLAICANTRGTMTRVPSGTRKPWPPSSPSATPYRAHCRWRA